MLCGAADGQHLVEPFEGAGGGTGRLLVKPTSEIANSRSALSVSSSSQACRSAPYAALRPARLANFSRERAHANRAAS